MLEGILDDSVMTYKVSTTRDPHLHICSPEKVFFTLEGGGGDGGLEALALLWGERTWGRR